MQERTSAGESRLTEGLPPNRLQSSIESWMKTKIVRAGFWLLPVLFLFWVYRDGLSTWFVADDFAWLSLLHLAQVRHDLLHELFAPMAQGTIRPWSERGLFMALDWLFGMDSLPFRLVAFATAAADLLLIAWVTLRATGSRVAGFLAPVLWAANTALVRAMTWSSAYNEVLCPLFLLTALALFIRYVETGRRAFWWWQLVVFSLGFGVLETNVVYPAIAAAWVIFDAPASRRRQLTRSLLPLAGISVAYFILHRIVAPLPASGVYALHFDGSMFKTLALYWKWSVAPEPMERFGHRHVTALAVFLIGTLAVAGFTATELARRRVAVMFFLSWFVVTLVPVMPLPGHRTDYYLTIPIVGLAMLGGAAAGRYWNQPWPRRAAVAIPILVYLWAMVPVGRAVTHWWLERSLGVRTLVLGVEAARRSHPGKAIVVEGVTTELFNLSLAHAPFVAARIDDVYLTPESGLTIKPDNANVDLQALVSDPIALAHGLTHNEVVVYSLESDHLRNITEAYSRHLTGRVADRLPSRVDVGNILYSWLLGPSWLPPESGIRWMPGVATVRVGVPEGGGSKLEIEGFCPEAQLLKASRHLMVLVNGVVAADTRIYDPESNFHRLFDLPGALAGQMADLEIRVDPVDRKDGQAYGLVFGKISILP